MVRNGDEVNTMIGKPMFTADTAQGLAQAVRVHTARQPPNAGPDLECVGLIDSPTGAYTAFTFYSRATDGKELFLSRNRIDRWTSNIDKVPVILLARDGSGGASFRVFFDWILDPPDYRNTFSGDKPTRVDVSEFRPLVEAEDTLARAIAAEAGRVRGSSDSPWRWHSSPVLPMTIADLFSHFGRITEFEPYEDVVTAVISRKGPITEADLAGALRHLWKRSLPGSENLQTDAIVQHWLSNLGRQPSSAEIAFECAQFRRFVASYRKYQAGEAFEIPGFVWWEVSRFRVYCSGFTDSFGLLKCVVEDCTGRRTSDQICTALHILMALGSTGGRALESACADLIRKAVDRYGTCDAGNSSHYNLVRGCYQARAAVEGGPQNIGVCVDLVHRHRKEGWDPKLHRGFYGDDLRSIQALTRLLEHPKPRDANIGQIQAVALDQILGARQRRSAKIRADLCGHAERITHSEPQASACARLESRGSGVQPFCVAT